MQTKTSRTTCALRVDTVLFVTFYDGVSAPHTRINEIKWEKEMLHLFWTANKIFCCAFAEGDYQNRAEQGELATVWDKKTNLID